jgi:hypothetical protein
MNTAPQVKTKQRVADHGEVFTAHREVNAMLDLVKQETERIDSRFLEPTCGTGNFLTEILKRKLNIVHNRYAQSQIDYERYSLIAVSSMYGIDILQDNVLECQKRLYDIFKNEYLGLFNDKIKSDYLNVIAFVLQKNILWGDALTLKTVCKDAKPITFCEWSAVNGSLIKRRDFTLANLLDYQPMGGDTLFSDTGTPAIIPKAVKEYPAVHFMELINAE